VRPIKFRAWDKRINKWREMDKFERMAILESPDFIIEQFTGLHDKNGREIYEGDIVQHSPAAAKWVIVYRMGSFCTQNVKADMECYVVTGYASESEVIGNIHENPELLK